MGEVKLGLRCFRACRRDVARRVSTNTIWGVIDLWISTTIIFGILRV